MRISTKAGLAASAALLSLQAGAAFACGFQRSAEASSQMQLAQAGEAARRARRVTPLRDLHLRCGLSAALKTTR